MSLSMTAEPVAPRKIAGGYVLVPVRQIISTWHTCRKKPLGIADFRTWLACHEIVARRCTSDDSRSPTYGFAELARLNGVSEKRAKASVARLVAAGLLAWSDHLIEFPDSTTQDDDSLTDTIGGGKGFLAIPRRMLRLLVGGAKPALIATVLAILLRCLSRGRGGFQSRGRIKASWIAKAFDIDLRRVKQARKELIALGWLTPGPSDQWAMNRWGRAYHINLDWERARLADDRRLPPPPAADGPRLPPPDLQTRNPFGREKHQEPGQSGPAGVQIPDKETEENPISPEPPRLGSPPSPEERKAARSTVNQSDPAYRRPSGIGAGAGGGTLPPPRLADVRMEDLRDAGRLLDLHEQAVAGGLIGSSEADRLRFLAAAEHARAIGSRNPPGLFARLVRGRLWGYLTQDDEDAASRRLKLHLFGSPRGCGGGSPPSAVAARSRLSADALMVREVRGALARAGYHGDPFPLVRAREGSWTRDRWDAALAELEEAGGGL